jgi:formylglycine-generating enzyme required for sulfatase activity
MTSGKQCGFTVIFLISFSLFAQGCAATSEPVTATGIQATPTAVLSPGDIRERHSDGMKMVYVPAGDFMMGSDYLQTRYARKLCNLYSKAIGAANCQPDNFGDESPAHPVALSGFWIDQTEVTNGQYQKCEQAGACMPPNGTGSHFRPTYYGDPEYTDYPVILVTREQASQYCRWTGGSLPTEAEWEYAARGPESWIYPWGNDFDGTRLNYCDASCDAGPNDPDVDDGYPETAPVGSFPSGASWVGALDMAGNVREWVADGYGPYTADPQVDPTGPADGGPVPHGGSWLDLPNLVRSANRGGNVPGYYRDYYGFRCRQGLH